MLTDSGGCTHSPVTGHTPQLLGTLPRLVPVVSAPSYMRCGDSLVAVHSPRMRGRVERRLELLLQGNFPKCPQGLFLFGKILLLNPVVPSIQGRACPLTQPTSPARSRTVWVRVAHGPTFKSPQPAPMVSVGLQLHPYSPPCDFKQAGLSQCCLGLVWQRRGTLTWLSPRSPVAGPAGAGLGLQPL